MAVIKIYELVLYTTDKVNPSECQLAKAWMDHAQVKYLHLHYSDQNQLPIVLQALNTWWQNPETTKTVSQWPFIVWKEQHDDRPITFLTADFVEGLDNIKNKVEGFKSIIE